MTRQRDDRFVTAKDCWYVCGKGALVHAILLSLATQDGDRATLLRGLFRELFDKERMAPGATAQKWRAAILEVSSEAAFYLASLLNPERVYKEYDNLTTKFNVIPASEHYARSLDEMITALWPKLEEEGESEK